ncbi:MAG: disulfide bond formation protein B [Gammaproteobacteria bacterium]|nr:disulfide bond formation protein B [Gammaproteobacteria bacterium]
MSNTLINNLNRATSESWAIAIVLFTGILLTGALVMEHAFGMDPCPLCLMQRIWFFIAGIWAYASLLHNPRWGIYPLLCVISATIGGGFSINQLRLQGLPADQVPTCGPDMAYMLDVFPLSEILKAMTSGTGDCAEVVPVFGLPIPLWALLGFIAIGVLTVMQWRAGN